MVLNNERTNKTSKEALATTGITFRKTKSEELNPGEAEAHIQARHRNETKLKLK